MIELHIEPFGVEEWMNRYETKAKYNIAETCVESLKVEELLNLSQDPAGAMRNIAEIKLTYGEILGSGELRKAVASLYKSMNEDNVLITQGGIGANFLTQFSLVNPGDGVISVYPTYQQLYSVPKSFGASVHLLPLRPENNFLPDLNELEEIAKNARNLKMICLNNPNNPTGALMDIEFLKRIVDIAKRYDAYILCDEVYRGLEHEASFKTPSIVDLYEKGISTGSMSKVFSLAGLRLGWIVGSPEVVKQCFSHRDYMTISCGRVDECLALIALKNKDKLLERNLGIVRKNYEMLSSWVDDEKRVRWVPPKAGTTAFLNFSDYGIPSSVFCEGLLAETGAFLVPGSAFGPEFNGWARIGYACASEVLQEGLKSLSNFLKKKEGEMNNA
ncbi:Aspartate/methionine/tyrosine aminotransferase [Acetomicrobium thermoterrenum DSM 13490]|jgi:aspartate/methionine/tyrosine aminotransferase|uniref:Aminotransferase n=1 Tax=Acetomicrobium thermoterrenum DSM 13490 TaxID=1120987 RepID=A0A1H3F525_9BACT|nr:aminotransferase [Acetomicrobium thermoterrenum]SDX86091.1 Aspartate/methionine/tyrosine aminotransferase [Acetomicrobium thermoterrenum DSM 13490]